MTHLMPLGSMDLPSEAILITVSVSGTCLSKTTMSTLFSFPAQVFLKGLRLPWPDSFSGVMKL